MIRYRLTVASVVLSQSERLLYGEAVETSEAEAALTSQALQVQVPAGTPPQLILYRGVLSPADLKTLSAGLTNSVATLNGYALKTGALAARGPVVVVPKGTWVQDEAPELHPDGRFTYRVTEWWDTDEETLERLVETRAASEIGLALHAATGLPIHQAADRIGNFAVFERLSNYYLDVKADLHSNAFWIRALYDGQARPAQDLALHVRFLSGSETVGELVVDLPESGFRLDTGANPSQFSTSLFSKADGKLLAGERAGLWGAGGTSVRTGAPMTVNVTDSSGAVHSVSWTQWTGGRQRGHRSAPWVTRTSTRHQLNAQANERRRIRLFHAGQRADAMDHIRELLRTIESPFVYIWDPYLDVSAVKDFLGWIDPNTPCKVLTCARDQQGLVAAALNTLRTGPPTRSIECKQRRQVPGGAPLYHDRCIIADGVAWVLGSSLNSIGKKWALCAELVDADRLRWLFEDEWSRAPGTAFTENLL